MQDIEANMISAFVVSSENLNQAVEFGMTDTWFSAQTKANIFNFLSELVSDGESWTPTTSANILMAKNAYDKFPSLIEICDYVPDWAFSVDDITDAFDVVRMKYLTAKVIEVSTTIKSRLLRFDDPLDISADMIQLLEDIGSGTSTIEVTNNDIAENLIELDTKIRDGETVGLPFPWPELQTKTFGIPFKAVSPLTGRDGKGKSRLVTYLAWFWATHGLEGLYFPYEDTDVRCLRNIASAVGEYDAFSFNKSGTSDEMFDNHKKCIGIAKKLPIHICDYETSIKRIVSKIAELKRKHDIKWVIIDGFKDISGTTAENRTQEEVKMIRMLTKAARKYDVAIIPVMHVNKVRDDVWISKQDITGSGDQTKSARMVMVYQDHVPAEIKNISYEDIIDDNFFILDIQKASYGNRCMFGLIKELEKGRFIKAEGSKSDQPARNYTRGND